MKKIKLLIAAMLTCSMLSSAAAVCAAQIPETPDVSPQYTGITSMTTPFLISNTGYATCSSTVSIKNGYSVTAILELQQEASAGVWEPIATWTQSSSDYIAITKHRYVSAGYDYRLKLIAKVYDSRDVLIEGPCKYSAIIHYP